MPVYIKYMTYHTKFMNIHDLTYKFVALHTHKCMTYHSKFMKIHDVTHKIHKVSYKIQDMSHKIHDVTHKIHDIPHTNLYFNNKKVTLC